MLGFVEMVLILNVELILDYHPRNGWERVRFKNLNREFVGRLNNLRIPKLQTDTYYVKIEHVSSILENGGLLY